MRSTLLLACVVGLASCVAGHQPTPQQKLATLVEQHPELTAKETIRVEVPVVVPQVEFQIKYVPVRDTLREQREGLGLDSLLRHMDASLDSVQRAAARSQVAAYVRSRPVLNDTLCFDTLGVKGWVWRTGTTYQIWVVRKSIEATGKTDVVATKLVPCPSAPEYLWYDPRGWPWWMSFLAGLVVGVGFCLVICSLVLRATR
ncbi:hypothetical protein [Hymenobacter metallicola]|uniref:Uncharacterized protein n=1 Tax=Hymenobacter metallicola TaxID=2563114 RepID=A0A4Z0Q227_9BACT|nr:hypothetical protein [Hymenobacter metallicola]TGE23549.1 hypothetical protein E5K02_20400 [Hymenobacter metallicola]